MKRPKIRIIPEWTFNVGNIKCKIFGHKNFLYNFPSMANRSICPRCCKKFELDLHNLEWKDVEKFSTNVGTDEEIIKRWTHPKF